MQRRLSPTHRSRAVHAWLLATLTALLVIMVDTSTAQAHTELLAASPEAGSELGERPDEIVLTFDEPIEPAGDALVLTDGDGVEHELEAEVGPEPNQLRSDVPEEVVVGQQLLSWRFISGDGHVQEDELEFVVAAPAGGSEEPAGTDEAEEAEPGDPVDAPDEMPDTTVDEQAAGAAGADDGGAAPWLTALVVLAVAGGVAVMLLKGRRGRSGQAAS